MNVTDDMVERALDEFEEDVDWRNNPDNAHILRRYMRRALEAALSAPASGGTVPVRVAVAFDDDGDARATDIRREEKFAWRRLAEDGFSRRSCIATIDAPLPRIAEVAGRVEGGLWRT